MDKTKTEFLINLNKIDDLKSFLEEMTYHIKSDVDLIYGRQIIDAKSLLGVISVSCNNVIAKIHSDDLSEIAYFKSVCERYEVKK